MRTTSKRAFGAVAVGALLLTGCGGSNDDPAGRAAPDPASFPNADGGSLDQILSEATSQGPVVSPAGQVYHEGENRYSFGVFTPGRDPIADAEVALYAAPGSSGQAEGPFTARVESLETDAAYEAKTTADDPDSATTAYVTELDFNRAGEWRIVALIKSGDALQASRVPSAVVGRNDDIPQVGEKAPRVHTLTAEDVGGDVSQIDTRVPASDMHDDDLAEVLGRKPVVLLFATPALCQSRVCGPVVDEAEQVRQQYGDRVAFIHQEIYNDNDINQGLRSQVRDYKLPTEPWLFVIDKRGEITTSIEGAFSVPELEKAVQQVAGPPS